MSFLLNLILGLFKGWLASRKSTDQRLGAAQEDDDILRNTMKAMHAEAQAAANAPQDKTAMEALLEEHKL